MGVKNQLAMIHHRSGNSFFCLKIQYNQIIKLQGCVREFKDMISDTR